MSTNVSKYKKFVFYIMFTDLRSGYQSLSKWLFDAEKTAEGDVIVTSPDGRPRVCIDKKGLINVCFHHPMILSFNAGEWEQLDDGEILSRKTKGKFERHVCKDINTLIDAFQDSGIPKPETLKNVRLYV